MISVLVVEHKNKLINLNKKKKEKKHMWMRLHITRAFIAEVHMKKFGRLIRKHLIGTELFLP